MELGTYHFDTGRGEKLTKPFYIIQWQILNHMAFIKLFINVKDKNE